MIIVQRNKDFGFHCKFLNRNKWKYQQWSNRLLLFQIRQQKMLSRKCSYQLNLSSLFVIQSMTKALYQHWKMALLKKK